MNLKWCPGTPSGMLSELLGAPISSRTIVVTYSANTGPPSLSISAPFHSLTVSTVDRARL
jgi:hypothetical protein